MPEPTAAIPPPPGTGRWILRSAWASNGLAAAVTIPVALGARSLLGVAQGVCVGLFLISIPVWTVAFARALARTTRGDNIVIGNLFWLSGSAPKPVRTSFRLSVLVSVVIAAVTAAATPFATLIPMLPLGLTGLWGSRYGLFPARPRPTAARARRTGG